MKPPSMISSMTAFVTNFRQWPSLGHLLGPPAVSACLVLPRCIRSVRVYKRIDTAGGLGWIEVTVKAYPRQVV